MSQGRRFLGAGLALLCTAGSAFAYQTENVFVVVIDGMRALLFETSSRSLVGEVLLES